MIPYLLVGGFNTVFGYTTFAILNFFFRRWGLPVSYIFAFAVSNMINITVAWANYKFFVFKTRGNYLREWLKAMAVYWSQFLPGVIMIPLAVRLLNWLLPKQLHGFHRTVSTVEAAPYIASAFLTVFGVVSSFLLHKNVTFRQNSTATQP